MASRHFRGGSLPHSKTVIQELEDDISRIDKGIGGLRRKKKICDLWPLRYILKEPLHHGATLDRLFEERQLLSQTLYSHTAAHFVLQKFPFEIWELIFQYSAPDSSSNDPFDQLSCPSIRQAPLSLSHVNRQWRTWIHNMPTLWTRLKIQGSKHAGRMGFVLEGVKEWLSHANQRLLTLSIKIVEERQKEADDCGLMDFIWGFSFRWQHLQLDIDSAVAMRQTLDRMMPCLVTLAFVQWAAPWFLDPRVPEEKAPLLSDFRTAERLKNPQRLVLPWKNLRRLSSAYQARVNAVLRLLKDVPGLESCSLVVESGDTSEDGNGSDHPTEDVYLASLRVLELHSTSATQVGLVLDHLLLPQLQVLRLHGEVLVGPGRYRPSTWGWPKEAVYRLAGRQAAASKGTMTLSELALKGTMGFKFSEEDIQDIRMNISSLRLIDARDAVAGVKSWEHVYFPQAEEGTEDWHGLRVLR